MSKNIFNNLLYDIDTFLTSGQPLEEVLQNICILLKEKVYHYDWVGFYFADNNTQTLRLGPFAGKPTDHICIPFGKGVCGQVAESKMSKVVQDVSEERNYISCSSNVQSEIVVPVIKNGEFVAQIDIDSHSPAPFSREDEEFLTNLCSKISTYF